MRFSATRKAKGFTLIELLVVIAILAALGSIVWVAWGTFANKKEYARAQVEIGIIAECVEAYLTDNDELPWGDGDEDSANTIYQIISGDFDGDGETDAGEIRYCKDLQFYSASSADKPNGILCEKLGRGKYAIIDPWGGYYRYIVGHDVTISSPKDSKRQKKLPDEGPGFNTKFDIFSQGPDAEGDGLDNEDENADNISNCTFS